MNGLTRIALSAALSVGATASRALTHVDVLVAYDTTAEAWLAADGRTPEEFAAGQVAKMNTVLADSGLASDFDVRLAGTCVGTTTYVDGTSAFSDTLNSLSESGDEQWKAYRDERDAKGADIMMLFVNAGHTTGMVGLSNGMEPYFSVGGGVPERQWGLSFEGAEIWLGEIFSKRPFGVCDISAGDGSEVFTHEIGHIMGAGHSDVLLGNPGPQLYAYSTGWAGLGSDGVYYTTVMGYATGAVDGHTYKVLPLFSSPDVQNPVTGEALGDAMHDNVATLRNTCAVVAAFRESTIPDESDPPVPVNPVDPPADPGTPVVPDPPSVQPTPIVVPTVSAAAWAANNKGKAYGLAADASGNVVASVVLNVTARGKATVKFTAMGGNTSVKGFVTLSENEEPQVVVGDMSLVYDESAGLWRGSKGEMPEILIVPGKPSSAGADGLYTAYATAADGSLAGFATVTVKNGKGKVQGQVNGKRKVSANGSVVAVEPNVLLVPVVKRGGVQGGVEVASGETLAGSVKVDGAVLNFEGAKWDASTPQSALDGLSLVLGEGEDALRIPLAMKNASKVAAVANEYKAKFSLQPKKGTFKGNLKTAEGKVQFTGAMVRTANGLMGFGSGFGAGRTLPVWVE